MEFDILTTVFLGISILGCGLFTGLNIRDRFKLSAWASFLMVLVAGITITAIWMDTLVLNIVATSLVGISMLLGTILAGHTLEAEGPELAFLNALNGIPCILALIALWV